MEVKVRLRFGKMKSKNIKGIVDVSTKAEIFLSILRTCNSVSDFSEPGTSYVDDLNFDALDQIKSQRIRSILKILKISQGRKAKMIHKRSEDNT